MPQQQSPWLDAKYGWNFGESNWNTGVDENLLKFSFMFDRNVDSIVASLPAAVNGQAHYLTTDNRLYFAVGTAYFSTPVPKWFIVVERSTGQTYQYNGTALVQIDSPAQLDTRLDAVELTVASLGTAAFQNVEDFATRVELDVVEGQSQRYTDALRDDLANPTDPASGGAIIARGAQVVASIAALKQLLKTSPSKYAFVTGYYAAGDGGGGSYYLDPADTVSADNQGTIIVAADGGRWKLVTHDILTVSQSGSESSGVTTALSVANEVVVDASTALDGQVDTAGLSSITGRGMNAILTAPSLDSGESAIVISPPADNDTRENMEIAGLYLITASGGPSVLVKLDSDMKRISRMRVDNSLLRSTNGSRAFSVANTSRAADKFAVSSFRDTSFGGGVGLVGAGDSILFDHCTFTGVNQAVYADLVSHLSSGAGDSSMLTIFACNSTANLGFHIRCGTRTKILYNNIEGGNGPGSSNALIYLEGGVGERIEAAEVVGNYLSASPNVSRCVKVGSCDQTHIANNTLACLPNEYAIEVTANAKNTRIGPNTYITTAGFEVLDNGIGTMGIFKTLSLLAGWAQTGGRGAPGFFKDTEGVVTLSGSMTGGTVTDGTFVGVLPVGFRPVSGQDYAVTGFGPAAPFTARITVAPSGQLILYGAPAGVTSDLSLGGISFYAPLA